MSPALNTHLIFEAETVMGLDSIDLMPPCTADDVYNMVKMLEHYLDLFIGGSAETTWQPVSPLAPTSTDFHHLIFRSLVFCKFMLKWISPVSHLKMF